MEVHSGADIHLQPVEDPMLEQLEAPEGGCGPMGSPCKLLAGPVALWREEPRPEQIRIWARKEAVKNGYVDYALNITGPIFSFLEDLFNVSYPLPKTDLVALPDFGAGAMENWGLMTFQESSLMYLPSDKFTSRKAMIAIIVSHELGHQWFGNLVTMNWWNDLWLNEGLASYFEYLGATFVEPKLSLDKIFYDHVVQPVLREDNEIGVRSLSESEDKIKGSFSLMSLFDSITYNKVVDAQDEVQLPASVKQIMDSWTCQNGFPVLTLNLTTGTISQEQFLNKKNENSTDSYKFGYIQIETALELTKYLAREDELFIWNVVLLNLVPENLESTLKNYEVYPLLKKYLLKRVLPIYRYYAGFIRQNVDALEDDYFAQYGKELLHDVLKVMGRFVNTDVQIQELQVFYNATLEEDERVAATLLLEFTKFENMERRELLIKVANWLQKNVDD
ncbi:aminopeptidase Q [Grus japonensis]|uniref:Aminopeptidase Q n=1 Tax=Grus japonensis TaxID=30415 RepID=A0ABC9Y8R5_GRUJA